MLLFPVVCLSFLAVRHFWRGNTLLEMRLRRPDPWGRYCGGPHPGPRLLLPLGREGPQPTPEEGDGMCGGGGGKREEGCSASLHQWGSSGLLPCRSGSAYWGRTGRRARTCCFLEAGRGQGSREPRHGTAPPAWDGCPLPQCRLGCWGLPRCVLKAKTLLPGRRVPAPLGQGWGCLCARSSPYSPAKIPGQSSPAKALKSDLL